MLKDNQSEVVRMLKKLEDGQKNPVKAEEEGGIIESGVEKTPAM